MKEKLSTLVMTVVAAALVLSGCQTAPAEPPPAETLPQPEFPLTEEAVNAALEQSGFPGEISAEETQSYQEGHIAYSLRDDSRTYTAGGNAVLSAGISSSLVDGPHRRLLPGHGQTDPGAQRFYALHRDPYHQDLPVGGGLSGLPEGAGGDSGRRRPAARDPAGPRVITIHNAINKPPDIRFSEVRRYFHV